MSARPSAATSGAPGGRGFGEWLAIGMVTLGVLWFALRAFVDTGPRFEGKSVAAWMETAFRTGHRSGIAREDLANVEARIALLSLRTQAVPALVEAVLSDVGRRPFQQALAQLASSLGEPWGTTIAAPGQRAGDGLAYLFSIRPSTRQVMPLLESALSKGGESTERALSILSRCHDDDGWALAEWQRRMAAGGEGWDRSTIEAVLLHLRPPSETAIALATERLGRIAHHSPARDVLVASAGDPGKARTAVPALERILRSPDSIDVEQLWASVLWLEAEPDSREAADALRRQPLQPAFDASNQITNGLAVEFCAVLDRFETIRSPVTLGVLEALVREEVSSWETRGMSQYACFLLDRFAPERAAVLYREQLGPEHKDNIRVAAAGALLRVDAGSVEAIEVLGVQLGPRSALAPMALESLAFASLDCAPAQCLMAELAARDGPLRARAELALRWQEYLRLERALRGNPKSQIDVRTD